MISGPEIRYLLDTNAVIALNEGEQALIDLLTDTAFALSATVIGELYYGVFNSQRVEANLAKFEAVIATQTILPCTIDTGRLFGQIRAELKAKGRPIPENDIWIAASARQHRLALVTRDAHFAHINDLTIVHW